MRSDLSSDAGIATAPNTACAGYLYSAENETIGFVSRGTDENTENIKKATALATKPGTCTA